jgi:CBS-domain-containing membrane protein
MAARKLGCIPIVASWGGSAVIAFGMPRTVMAQPRSLVGGHVLSTLIGLGLVAIFGASPWVGVLGCSCAVAAMLLTRTVHSPAGSDPLIIAALNPGWQFAWLPMLPAVVFLSLGHWLFVRVDSERG